MNKKYSKVLESPSSYCKSKITKQSNNAYIETPSTDVICETTSDSDEDILSISDDWCSFDDLFKV